MTKYLGIDYGTVHIGLAISEHTLATPLASLQNTPRLVSRLSSLVYKEGITHVICGIPEGALAPRITAFAKELEKITHLPVILHQETLSTQDAILGLRAGHAGRTKLKNDHAYAACLILEDYLEINPMLY